MELFLSKSRLKDWLIFIIIYFSEARLGVTHFIREMITGRNDMVRFGSELFKLRHLTNTYSLCGISEFELF